MRDTHESLVVCVFQRFLLLQQAEKFSPLLVQQSNTVNDDGVSVVESQQQEADGRDTQGRGEKRLNRLDRVEELFVHDPGAD